MSSFFGGPFAALIMGALNVHRLGRWRRDGAWVLGVFVLALAWSLWLPTLDVFVALDEALRSALGRNAWRYVGRAFSLCLFGLLYWRHRRIDRAATLFGMDRPNGWVAGVAAILVGSLVSLLLAEVRL